jgi:two-component system, cell cycle response regulator
LKRFVFPGLSLYCIVAGMGLFLRPAPPARLLLPWTAGFIALVFALSYTALFAKNRSLGFYFVLCGVVGLNFIIQMTGGGASPLFPVYFLIISAAAFQHPTRAYYVTSLILAIEALNLVMGGNDSRAGWLSFAGYAGAFAATSFLVSRSAHRIERDAKTAKDTYRKLLSDAEAVDPLAGGTNVEALTEKRRQAVSVGAARDREETFNALIDGISGFAPAHTYALFLNDRDDGTLSLRAIRSHSKSLFSGPVTFAQGNGLIGICAARKQAQYLPFMVIPSMSLGYYARNAPVKSFLALPIVQGDRCVGVLALDSLENEAFPAETQEVLAGFIPFFVQIIETFRISMEMDLRAKNFSALHDMSSILNSSLQISDVLGKLTVQFRSVVPFDFCAFLLYDERAEEAVITALSGYNDRFMDARFPVAASPILTHMLHEWKQQRKCIIHHDPDLGARGKEIGLFPLKGMQQPIKSLFGRTLAVRDRFLGAVFLASVRTYAFTEYHRNFMNTLLNQVSMVVDNSLLHRSISEMARTDGMTGLLNHRTFVEKFSEECRRLDREIRPFSILLMDIDKFKNVNDRYGHPVGDKAIQAVAEVLRETARGSDFVARYGGEEFAVGMVDTLGKGAGQVCERIRTSIEKKVITRVFDGELRVTVSIGVSSFPEDVKNPADLVAAADSALYQAKRAGRNRVCMHQAA